jgi:putative transcriptional regulator
MEQTTNTSFDQTRRLTGRMLIAMPHLETTPFGRSVTLICSHDSHHAFGVIVNKPMSGVTLGEVVNEMNIDADEQARKQQVFFGGPVDLERGAVLHSLDFLRSETVMVTSSIGLTATKEALAAIAREATAPRDWMLVMGHSGWDGGQLENEIKRNDWLSAPASSELVFGNSGDAWIDAMAGVGVRDLGTFSANDSPVARPN